MAQLELAIGLLIKRWHLDVENILIAADGLSDAYDTGYAHGIRQAAHELSGFMWDRACHEQADRVIDQTHRRRDGW